MLEANLFKVFTSRLNEAGITYMTTGSVAGIIYGQPRITHDIDLVVELHSEQLPQLLAKLSPEEFYCPPEEVIRIWIAYFKSICYNYFCKCRIRAFSLI